MFPLGKSTTTAFVAMNSKAKLQVNKTWTPFTWSQYDLKTASNYGDKGLCLHDIGMKTILNRHKIKTELKLSPNENGALNGIV